MRICPNSFVREEATKDRFCEELTASVRGVDKTDKLIILGDFNARDESNQQLWENVLGPHRSGRCNENGLRLLSFCAENELLITNTIFQLLDMHKTTWKHPISCQWHLLDYVLVRQADRRNVALTRVMRGADCETDHRMVRTRLNLHIRPPARKTPAIKRLDAGSLQWAERRMELKRTLEHNLRAPTIDGEISTATLTTKWQSVAETINNCSEKILDVKKRNHRDWFDEGRADVAELLEERNNLIKNTCLTPQIWTMQLYQLVDRECSEKWEQCRKRWWESFAAEVHQHADTENQQGFYSAIKAVCGPRLATHTQ